MSNTMTNPKVSIIIPSWTGEVSRPTRSIEQQTFRDYEVVVVKGESPAAHARNLGVMQSSGDILLFLDDDTSFGDKHILATLVDLLMNEPQTAVGGVSRQVAVDVSRFQQAIASQVPRYTYPIIPENLVSNPPLDHYGFTAVTTCCCAVRRTVFEEVGGFNEGLMSGEDTDFFYRVHRQGHNLAVAANSWVYHDPPANMNILLRKSFWYGMGHALEARISPERGMDVLPLNHWYGKLGLIAAVVGFPFAFFVHYYFDPVRRLVFGFRPLKTLSTYAGLCGYVYSWYHSKLTSTAVYYKVQSDGLKKTAKKV